MVLAEARNADAPEPNLPQSSGQHKSLRRLAPGKVTHHLSKDSESVSRRSGLTAIKS